jgi:AraC-like DNA-binding protein
MNPSKLERLQEKSRKRNAVELVTPEPTSIALDEHFSVSEVAAMWGMSPKTIRRMFGTMEGVIKLGSAKKTLFIPARLLEQKHRELAG